MRRRLAGLACISLVACSLATLGSVSFAATADDGSGVLLPLKGFDSLVADPVHDQEFVTAGRADDDSVVVTDIDGRVKRVVEGLPGAAGMALSADDSTLYVAVAQAHEVVAIDTTTFTERVLSVGDGSCPERVAVTGGLVWFSQTCDGPDANDPSLDVLDPLTGVVHHGVMSVGGRDPIHAVPAEPNRIYMGGDSDLLRIDVTGADHPTARVAASYAEQPGDIAVTADASRVLTALGGVYDGQSMRAVDSYPWQLDRSDNTPRSVAVRADGVAAIEAEQPGPDLFVYPAGQSVSPRTYDLNSSSASYSTEIPDHSLAFGASRLFAVTLTRGSGPAQVRLHVLDESGLIPDVPVGSHRLPLMSFGQVVFDTSRNRGFATAGRIGNGVAVFDAQGRVVTVLQHLPRPDGMVLSPNGTTLFVALSGMDAVAAIDTRTLKVRKLATGRYTCPDGLGFAAGLVWFRTSCQQDVFSSEYLGTLDPVSGRVHARRYDTVMQIFSSATRPNLLYLNGHPGRLAVTGGRHPGARPLPGARLSPYIVDVAAAPDGMTLLTAQEYPQRRLARSAGTLHLTGAVYFPNIPVAVAIRSDDLTATGLDRGEPSDVYVSNQPQGVAARGVAVEGNVQPRGLAFGRRALYVVTSEQSGNYMRVLPMPAPKPLRASVDQAIPVAGRRMHVAGHFASPGTSRLVRIYATPYGAHHRLLIGRGRSNRFGNVVVPYRPRVTTRFTVVAPRGRRRALTDTVGIKPALGIHESFDRRGIEGRPTLRVQAVPAHVGECLWVHVNQTLRSGGRRDHTYCRRLGRTGKVTYVFRQGTGGLRSLQLVPEWRGDRRNARAVGRPVQLTFH